MRRLASRVAMPIVLLGLWLLLNDSVSGGHLVLGAAIAIVLSLLAPTLRPVRASLSHPLVALRLIAHVWLDIAHSNLAVSWRILLGRRSEARPGFLDIPLRMRDPHALAALSCIITYTPGTVWAGHDAQSNTLTLHVLDLRDPEAWIRTVQHRYETPLMEIFE